MSGDENYLTIRFKVSPSIHEIFVKPGYNCLQKSSFVYLGDTLKSDSQLLELSYSYTDGVTSAVLLSEQLQNKRSRLSK